MQDAYELKQAIIAKLESDGADNAEEKLTSLYNELAEKNPIFKFNKQVAYYKLAQQFKATVDTHRSAVKNAMPISVDEALTSGKQNFNVSGFLLTDMENPYIHTFDRKDGGTGRMTWVTIADTTGAMQFTVFGDEMDKLKGLSTGDFIEVANAYWAKPPEYTPTISKSTSVNVVKATFELESVKGVPIKDLKLNDRKVIVGVIAYMGDQDLKTVFHCPRGHWYKDMTDNNVGELADCEKCGDIQEVHKALVGNDILFADESGSVNLDISTFTSITDGVGLHDGVGYVVIGQFSQSDEGNNIFRANTMIPLKKVPIEI